MHINQVMMHEIVRGQSATIGMLTAYRCLRDLGSDASEEVK